MIMRMIRHVMGCLRHSEERASDAIHRVEYLKERVDNDLSHDLYELRQRTDTLYRLVQSMRRPPENVR